MEDLGTPTLAPTHPPSQCMQHIGPNDASQCLGMERSFFAGHRSNSGGETYVSIPRPSCRGVLAGLPHTTGLGFHWARLGGSWYLSVVSEVPWHWHPKMSFRCVDMSAERPLAIANEK